MMRDGESSSGGAAAPGRGERHAALARCLLPNGLEVAYQSSAEVGFFYRDIFEKQIYLRHGVTLRDGDCVFDVGANVGFFTLFAHLYCRGVKVYAFEPAPPLFRLLRHNVGLHSVDGRLFNCGVSDRDGAASFTFYPHSSGMSSFHADEREEREALHSIMRNQLRQGVEGMEQVMRHVEDLLDERLKSETYECRLRRLSDVIREEGVERIDFLKVDVQKSEMAVLRGIDEGDWPKIRQIVVEVHDIEGRLDEMLRLLEARGFAVAVEQDDHYENSTLYNLFARRPETPAAPAGGRLDAAALRQMQERVRRQGEAMSRRRQFLDRRKDG